MNAIHTLTLLTYDILSTLLISFSLSLLLPLRYLVLRFTGAWIASDSLPDSDIIYEGTVWHERRHPIHQAFRFHVRYALIDLDRSPNVPPNHLSADEARKAAETNGPVFLLTTPPSVGYQHNPVSIYYCYHLQGSTQILKRGLIEGSNTPWVEKVIFSFDPEGDTVAKTQHFSPFMDMLGNWKIKSSKPGDTLLVTISVDHPQHGKHFMTSMAVKKVHLSSPADYELFFWLMPHKAAIVAYWQALKLWWKNVPFLDHPKYTDPGYRKEGLVREAKLQGCEFARAMFQNKQVEETNSASYVPTTKVKDRWFTWKEADWAWR